MWSNRSYYTCITPRFWLIDWMDGGNDIHLDRQIHCFYLQNTSLTISIAITVVQDTIKYALDFYNSILTGLPASALTPCSLFLSQQPEILPKSNSNYATPLLKALQLFSPHLEQNSNSSSHGLQAHIWSHSWLLLWPHFLKLFFSITTLQLLCFFLKNTKHIPTSGHLHLPIPLCEIFFQIFAWLIPFFCLGFP